MKNITHLTPGEQDHFIRCDCGEYIDMRDLGEVMSHQHWMDTQQPNWDYSVKIGEPVAYTKGGETLKLN
jgi:hypothetical protein